MYARYFLVLAIILTCACSSYTSGTKTAVKATLDFRTGEKNITEYSKFFTDIKIEEIVYRETGGLKEVDVRVANQKNELVVIELKGKWYDAQGFETADPKELWRHIMLNGNETKGIKLVSPNKDAVKLEILTRKGKFTDNY